MTRKLCQNVCGVWYGVVWYGMVWYGMVWYGMVWYGVVWFGLTQFIEILTHGERISQTGYCPIDRGSEVQCTYDVTSLSEKTRKSNHLLMSL